MPGELEECIRHLVARAWTTARPRHHPLALPAPCRPRLDRLLQAMNSVSARPAILALAAGFTHPPISVPVPISAELELARPPAPCRCCLLTILFAAGTDFLLARPAIFGVGGKSCAVRPASR